MTGWHIFELDIVLRCMMDSGMRLKFSNCHIDQRTVEVLGHEDIVDGLLPSGGNIE